MGILFVITLSTWQTIAQLRINSDTLSIYICTAWHIVCSQIRTNCIDTGFSIIFCATNQLATDDTAVYSVHVDGIKLHQIGGHLGDRMLHPMCKQLDKGENNEPLPYRRIHFKKLNIGSNDDMVQERGEVSSLNNADQMEYSIMSYRLYIIVLLHGFFLHVQYFDFYLNGVCNA